MITFYNKPNEKIEKWTKRSLKFTLKIFLPMYCIPPITASLYRYFILDLAEESFLMIIPSSYVFYYTSQFTYTLY